MREHFLYAQAAIHVGRQERTNPTNVIRATFVTVGSRPQGDDGDQARFLVGNHHQASSESGDVLECSGNGGGDSGFDLLSFARLGDKFDTESGHRGN